MKTKERSMKRIITALALALLLATPAQASKQTPVSITADGTYLIATVQTPKTGGNIWQGTVFFGGSFGGGTITLQASPDAGTTKISETNLSGTAFSMTSAGSIEVDLGNADTTATQIRLYAVMTGSTSPTVTATVFDNHNP
jgi:opacity protein-like surface antigen